MTPFKQQTLRTLLGASLKNHQPKVPTCYGCQGNFIGAFEQHYWTNSFYPVAAYQEREQFAAAISISRNIVIAAYDLLAAEGYVEPDRQGTSVTPPFPSLERRVTSAGPSVKAVSSRIANIVPTESEPDSSVKLGLGIPATSNFPFNACRHVIDKAIPMAAPSALCYGDPLRGPALQASIAGHISVGRGVRCQPDQIVIIEGAHENLTLCVCLLTDTADIEWVEDPGYRGAKAAMQSGNLRIKPIRIDSERLCTKEDNWKAE